MNKHIRIKAAESGKKRAGEIDWTREYKALNTPGVGRGIC
jgi:hypothetical protein